MRTPFQNTETTDYEIHLCYICIHIASACPGIYSTSILSIPWFYGVALFQDTFILLYVSLSACTITSACTTSIWLFNCTIYLRVEQYLYMCSLTIYFNTTVICLYSTIYQTINVVHCLSVPLCERVIYLSPLTLFVFITTYAYTYIQYNLSIVENSLAVCLFNIIYLCIGITATVCFSLLHSLSVSTLVCTAFPLHQFLAQKRR